MNLDYLILVFLVIFLGILFFLIEFFEKGFPKIHISYIAGISLAYFFFVILPEISEKIPQYPFGLEVFEFFFVVVGFVFVHIIEKLILQNVEQKSQEEIRKLIKKEKTLELVEKNIENLLTKELNQEEFDQYSLKEMSNELISLNKKEEIIKNQIENYKIKIQDKISQDLANLRLFINILYHLIIGIILVGLIFLEFLGGILFFFFAFFRTIVSIRRIPHSIFTDLEIYEKPEIIQSRFKKYINASSSLIGIFLGIVFDVLLPINLEYFYIIYSFISGAILYAIVREILPEKEKGKPIKFITGFLGFSNVIFVFNIFFGLI